MIVYIIKTFAFSAAIAFIIVAFINSVASDKKTRAAFSPGDKVAAFGCNGVVKKVSDNGLYLEVELEGAPTTMLFQLDGKLFKWSKCSSLEKL